MAMRFKGRTAVVTGAGAGIGREFSRTVASEGGRVAVLDIVLGNATRVADEIRASGGEAAAYTLDVTDYEACAAVMATVLERYGAIDILANVAGGSAGPTIRTKVQPFSESDPARWDEMFRLNVIGSMAPARAVIAHMQSRRKGTILNVSSIAGVIGLGNLVDYSSAKAAILMFTRTLASELAPFGVRVNSIAPGVTASERLRELVDANVYGNVIDAIPLRRLAEPSEMAAALAFLASDDAAYVTGQNLTIDGGLQCNVPF
jgi:2-hydroxycyclohexanecarboxyl-CoA dehydrogenase